MYEDLVLKVKNISIGLEEKTGSESPETTTWLLAIGRKEGLTPA
ncbi:unnamed protein product [Prunus brigantina]